MNSWAVFACVALSSRSIFNPKQWNCSFFLLFCVCVLGFSWLYKDAVVVSPPVVSLVISWWFQQHSRWVARLPGIWLRIMSVCNRTWTYYLPENHSLIHFIPFGLADRNSVWSHYPCQPLQTDMPPPREWWVGKDCSNFCSVGYSLPASQSDRQPS